MQAGAEAAVDTMNVNPTVDGDEDTIVDHHAIDWLPQAELLASGLATPDFVKCLLRQLRLRRDLRIIERDVVSRVRQLAEALHQDSSNWSPERGYALEEFHEVWVPRFKNSKNMSEDFDPAIVLQFIRNLDWLLFDGSVAETVLFEFKNESLIDDRIGQCDSEHSSGLRMITVFAGACKSIGLTIGTIVHEMIHAFILELLAQARRDVKEDVKREPWLTGYGKGGHGYCFQMLAKAMEYSSRTVGYRFNVGGFRKDGDFEGWFEDRLSGLTRLELLHTNTATKYENESKGSWLHLHMLYQDRANGCRRYGEVLPSALNDE
jgi:hypothetical protein